VSNYLKGLANKINGVEKEGFTQELDINSLVPSSNNFYGIREIEELAASIKENGLMHNLVVRKKDDGTYEIISGERRYRAAKSLGYKTLPCQVKEISDLDAEIMLIQANVEQRELLPSEKMEGIKRLKAIYEQKKVNGEELPKGKIRDLIGQDMKLSGVQVGRYQKVDKDLIEPLKEKLDKEEITLTQAHTLSSLNENEQKIIHEEIKDLDPKESKEEVEILINGIKQPVESELDKQLLDEMHPPIITEVKEESKDNSIKLKEAFKKFVNPRLIISNSHIKGMIYIKKYSISSDSILTVGDSCDKEGYLTIKINYFEKTDEIELELGKTINPKISYKISDGVYVWFKKSIGSII
jgi:ParB family chromosome partitioning protein